MNTIQEKEPLLPEPVCSRPKQNRFILIFKQHMLRILLVGLWLYLFFAFVHQPQQNDDIETYNQYEMHSVCHLDPGYSYDGPSEFEFDPLQFHSLLVEETQNNHGKKTLQIASGKTDIILNTEIDKIKVSFDIVLSHESLSDTIWIEAIQDQDTSLYSLLVHEDMDFIEQDACIKLNIKIQIPSADALKSLTLALSNNGININELVLDHAQIAVANGHIQFDALTVGSARFSVANGHVSGTLDTLSGDLSASAANGYNEINVQHIHNKEEGIQITLSAANGHNHLQVPVTFDSSYHLSNVVGKRRVESSEPTKLHHTSSGWRKLEGYFGTDQTKNHIQLSAANGNLYLNYQ